MNVTTVVRRATRLTRDISEGVVSFIGAKIKAPSNGIRSSPVSMILYNCLASYTIPPNLEYRELNLGTPSLRRR